jgi:uncharacterized cupredoxin-like copper-binding protein
VGETSELEWTSVVAPRAGGSVIKDKIDSIEMVEDFDLASKNEISPELKVTNQTDLVSQIKSSVQNINLGEEYTLDYLIKNQGPSVAEKIRLKPELNDCLSLISSETDKGKIWKNSFKLDELMVGESVNFKITVKPEFNCSKDVLENSIGVIDMEQRESSDKGDLITTRVSVNKEVDARVQVLDKTLSVHEGQDTIFEIKLDSQGPAFINKSKVKFEVSDSLEIIKIKTSKGQVKNQVWEVPNMKFKDSEHLQIFAKVKMKTARLKAYVKVKSHTIDKNDTNLSEDVYSKEYTIENESDLKVEVTASDKKVNTPYVSYTYKLKNYGPAVATNIKVTPTYDQKSLKSLSKEMSVDSAHKKSGVWTVKELYPGQTAEMLWTFELDNFTSPIADAGYKDFSMDQVDSEKTKDRISSHIEVDNTAKVKVKKSLSREDVFEGENYAYQITVENKGNQIARKVKLTDDIDSKIIKIKKGVKATRGKFNAGVWEIGTLRPKEIAILTIPLKFIGELKEDLKVVDPVDKLEMEQDSYYKLDSKFNYKVKNIFRELTGGADEQ